MILKIIRWIFGYIYFEIDKKNSRLFINLVSRFRMNLWDIKQTDKSLFAKITSSDFKKLNFISKRNNIKINIIDKKGLQYFYIRHKNRKGIIVGIILFFISSYISSLFIWKININGNENIEISKILDCLKDNGVYIGALRKNIDADESEQRIMEQIPNISWMSINLNGCIANVNIKQQIEKPENDSKSSGDIISECDAQIARMETFSGTPLVHVGDVVFKNQLLVGSYYKLRDGSINNVNAKANILAKISGEISEFEKLKQDIETEGKQRKIFYINLFGNEIKLNFWETPEDNWKKEHHENQLKIFNFEIPIKFKSEKFTEINKAEKILSKEEAIENAKKRAYEKLDKNLEIVDIKESFSEQKDGIKFKINFKFLKNIGVYKQNK